MMQDILERVRRKAWTIGQPLTRKPEQTGAPVSDLFVWRNSKDWRTFFELIDIGGLFVEQGKCSKSYVTFFFFDINGKLLCEKRVDSVCKQRLTIDLSVFTSDFEGTSGTFCVFHSRSPQIISDLGSHITERGYVSYRYKGALLGAYVHGNIDAISLLTDNRLQLLGSGSLLPREYRLQHLLQGSATYQAGIVNFTCQSRSISCKVISVNNGDVLEVQKARLKPRGSHLFQIEVKQTEPVRVVFNSFLVMSRPLMFRIQNDKLDIFHG